MPESDTKQPQVPPIFILSTHRSGSTLLRYIVDTHPKICCPGEVYLGQICQLLCTAYYHTVGMALSPIDIERRKVAWKEARSIVDNMMNSYAAIKNKEIWCEKTPNNVNYIKVLRNVFPDAAFICLYRNCMDVVNSCLEYSRYGFMEELSKYVHKSPGNIVAAMVENWVNYNTEILNLERANPSRCFRVKYESLVQNPEESLRPMFEFLGVEWDEGLLGRVFEAQHDEGLGDVKVMFSKKIEQSALGKGVGIPSWLVPADLLAQTNAISRELDYPEINQDSQQAGVANIPVAGGDEKSPDAAAIKDLFETHFPRQIEKNHDALKPVKAVVKFMVTGEDAGAWTIDLTKYPAEIKAGDGSADCSITVSSQDLLKIVSKELNPGECFLQGRLKVEGKVGVGMVVGRAIFEA